MIAREIWGTAYHMYSRTTITGIILPMGNNLLVAEFPDQKKLTL